jgi:hypothetical protein
MTIGPSNVDTSAFERLTIDRLGHVVLTRPIEELGEEAGPAPTDMHHDQDGKIHV